MIGGDNAGSWEVDQNGLFTDIEDVRFVAHDMINILYLLMEKRAIALPASHVSALREHVDLAHSLVCTGSDPNREALEDTEKRRSVKKTTPEEGQKWNPQPDATVSQPWTVDHLRRAMDTDCSPGQEL